MGDGCRPTVHVSYLCTEGGLCHEWMVTEVELTGLGHLVDQILVKLRVIGQLEIVKSVHGNVVAFKVQRSLSKRDSAAQRLDRVLV